MRRRIALLEPIIDLHGMTLDGRSADRSRLAKASSKSVGDSTSTCDTRIVALGSAAAGVARKARARANETRQVALRHRRLARARHAPSALLRGPPDQRGAARAPWLTVLSLASEHFT